MTEVDPAALRAASARLEARRRDLEAVAEDVRASLRGGGGWGGWGAAFDVAVAAALAELGSTLADALGATAAAVEDLGAGVAAAAERYAATDAAVARSVRVEGELR